MPKYKVTATKDVGYSAIIEADSQEEAWEIAKWGEGDWEKTDNGHDLDSRKYLGGGRMITFKGELPMDHERSLEHLVEL